MSTTTNAPISLRLTAIEMPLVFVKRIPSKLEAALRALKAGNQVEFTRAIQRAARLCDRARSILGNVAEVSRPTGENASWNLQQMMFQVLEDFKHVIFAMRTTLGNDDSQEYFKVEESDSTLLRPHDLSDAQAVETVRASLSELVTVMRQRIKARS